MEPRLSGLLGTTQISPDNHSPDNRGYTVVRLTLHKWEIVRKDNCKGRAVIRTDVDLIFIKNEHNDDCSDSAEVFQIIDLKSGLKSKAENTSTSLRQLFNDGVEDSSVADQISYPQLIDSMNKRRRLMTPVLPHTPMEASEIVASDTECFGKHFRWVKNYDSCLTTSLLDCTYL